MITTEKNLRERKGILLIIFFFSKKMSEESLSQV